MTGAIDGTVIREGIVGANGVKPLNIMALFISLAYLSISLDATGLFRFLALWVVRKGGSSGRKLYLYLYCFFLVCGVFVGNDPVILSGTAFLAYLTRISGITPPTAWIFAQFAAANMASVVLVSSNPTNLVLSGAFSLTFLTYTAHCILPFLAAAVFVYPVLVVGLFRSPDLIPRSIDVIFEDIDTGVTLVDQKGAVFGSILVLITLGVLVGTSAIGIPVWEVTVPPAVMMLSRDLHHDWTRHRRLSLEKLQSRPTSQPPVNRAAHESEIELHQIPSRGHQSSLFTAPPETLLSWLTRYFGVVSVTFRTVTTIVERLPLALLPFAFLMFILVQALATKGWVEVLARWWAAWIDKTGVLGAIGGMGFLACIACNVCGTNIGATILLARVIQLWISNSSNIIDTRTRDGAIYALAFGSNYGFCDRKAFMFALCSS
ncbi:hypothetical protein SCP_0305730 [Sparassis crispa]|uniref:Citrate transporter-like domain-containing protein n=1 Tax=Sparassis crispa TaxID=139825 RepID=A0A401GFH6_9APHY|nr:hypothetical protein SCP_0305730 [Sparassis crispa]GBE80853.1 hypothetical protein SCP_0305730 [Sparassis crispa]